MTWVWIAVAVAAVLLVGLLVLRGRGSRNSGAARASDVGPTNSADADAYGAHTQHRGNLHGGGGPF